MKKIVYYIYDDFGDLFRIVKTKWERDKLVNTYKGFSFKAIKTLKSKIDLNALGECLF